jgi:hypothetical protein
MNILAGPRRPSNVLPPALSTIWSFLVILFSNRCHVMFAPHSIVFEHGRRQTVCDPGRRQYAHISSTCTEAVLLIVACKDAWALAQYRSRKGSNTKPNQTSDPTYMLQ